MPGKRDRARCAVEDRGHRPARSHTLVLGPTPAQVGSRPTPAPLQAGDAPALSGSAVHPSPATAPREERRGEPVPRPLVSAAAAAAGAAGEAAFGGGQRGAFPGQAAGQTRAAASWATLSGCLQGGGSPAKHRRRKCDLVPLPTESHQAHTGCSTEQSPKMATKEAAAFKANTRFAVGAEKL